MSEEVPLPLRYCGFCGSLMVLAWSGRTPFGSRLHAYICPECFSTRYICSNGEDPVFKMLTEIQNAFMRVWQNSEKTP